MDNIKKIIHLKNFFDAEPSNERFLEEKEWIIEIYMTCLGELAEAHRVIERQGVMIEQMKEHIESSFENFKNINKARKREQEESDPENKKGKKIWIKKSKKDSSDSKN